MNGYICYYKNKRVEVYANTSYAAQQEAAKKLGAKKTYQVNVVLAELNGEPVVYNGTEFGS